MPRPIHGTLLLILVAFSGACESVRFSSADSQEPGPPPIRVGTSSDTCSVLQRSVRVRNGAGPVEGALIEQIDGMPGWEDLLKWPLRYVLDPSGETHAIVGTTDRQGRWCAEVAEESSCWYSARSPGWMSMPVFAAPDFATGEALEIELIPIQTLALRFDCEDEPRPPFVDITVIAMESMTFAGIPMSRTRCTGNTANIEIPRYDQRILPLIVVHAPSRPAVVVLDVGINKGVIRIPTCGTVRGTARWSDGRPFDCGLVLVGYEVSPVEWQFGAATTADDGSYAVVVPANRELHGRVLGDIDVMSEHAIWEHCSFTTFNCFETMPAVAQGTTASRDWSLNRW